MNRRSGGEILVDGLLGHGVDTVYCVPGESFIAALGALERVRDRIRLVTCRQEGAAANMADAYGKLTGRAGVCFVTRGPGATNASIGVHTAFQDSTPLVLLIGQVERGHRGREAFQEVDYEAMFAPLAKWVAEADSAAALPELVARAFATAVSGRPGPVVLSLPTDVLAERAETQDVAPAAAPRLAPDPAGLAALRDALAASERPLAILGGSGWTEAACRDFAAFAERGSIPVAAAFRRQDRIDNESLAYAGELGISAGAALAARVKAADLVLAVGARLGQATTSGYTLLDAPRPHQTLAHVYPDAGELGRVYEVDVPIVATVPEFARALEPVDGSHRRAWFDAARRDYLEHRGGGRPAPGPVDLAAVLTALRRRLPEDAVIANGAGAFSIWCHRYTSFRRLGTQLAPTSGAMGYAVPAAIAAKLLHPERDVVAITGDGDFQMAGQELATAVQEGADVVVVVVNNGMYGSIRMHQERDFPGRPYGTSLVNPDFAAYAEAFGAFGAVVSETGAFEEAFERALTAGRPALIELRVDPEGVTPTATLSEIRRNTIAP